MFEFDPTKIYTGTVACLKLDYGFIHMDERVEVIFMHRNNCRHVFFNDLKIGDRVKFRICASKSHPGKLIANGVRREEFLGAVDELPTDAVPVPASVNP